MRSNRHHSLLALFLATFLPFSNAQVLNVVLKDDGGKFNNWSWNPGGPVNVTQWIPPPPGYPMTTTYSGKYEWTTGIQLNMDTSFYNPANPPYSHMYLFLKGTTLLSNVFLKMYSNIVQGSNDAMPNNKLSDIYNGDVQLTFDKWVEVAIDMTTLPQTMAYNTFWLQSLDQDPKTNITFCAFFGNSDALAGSGRVAIKPPDAPDISLPADGTILADGTVFDGKIKFPNPTLSGPIIRGDQGNAAVFMCPETDLIADYYEAQNITIQAYRDSNVGPVPLSPYKWASFAKDQDGNPIWNLTNLWQTPDLQNRTFDAIKFPHPAYMCSIENADYIMIGNEKEASKVLVAWMPEHFTDQAHAIGGYAMYVLSKKDNLTGADTVAVEMRIRPNDVATYGMGKIVDLVFF